MKSSQTSPTDADDTFIGKTIVSKNGCILGTIKDIWYNKTTGASTEMVITPAKNIDPQVYPHTDQGQIVLPAECVLEVKDTIIYDGITRPPTIISHKA
jgi:sporulation protein YlmC with PRC-barrel domain